MCFCTPDGIRPQNKSYCSVMRRAFPSTQRIGGDIQKGCARIFLPDNQHVFCLEKALALRQTEVSQLAGQTTPQTHPRAPNTRSTTPSTDPKTKTANFREVKQRPVKNTVSTAEASRESGEEGGGRGVSTARCQRQPPSHLHDEPPKSVHGRAISKAASIHRHVADGSIVKSCVACTTTNLQGQRTWCISNQHHTTRTARQASHIRPPSTGYSSIFLADKKIQNIYFSI